MQDAFSPPEYSGLGLNQHGMVAHATLSGASTCSPAGIPNILRSGGQGVRERPFGGRFKRCTPTGIPPDRFLSFSGSAGRARTCDILINSQALYQPSYSRKFAFSRISERESGVHFPWKCICAPATRGEETVGRPAPHPNGQMRLPSGRRHGGELNPLDLSRLVPCSSFGIRRDCSFLSFVSLGVPGGDRTHDVPLKRRLLYH